jgi:hypothetical protein
VKLKWPGFDAKTVAAIEDYLELDLLTEISWREGEEDGWDRKRVEALGVYRFAARGRYTATNHSRPMIEVFGDGVGSGMAPRARESCPDCDDWSRTAVCDVHPELSLDEIEWHRTFDRSRLRVEFGPECDPDRTPEPSGLGEARPVSATLLAALDPFRNQYGYGFEVGQHGTAVWTIDTGA